MRQKIDVGDGLVAAGAALLLVSLFLDWYSPGANAWSAFELIDLVLAALAIAALVGAVRPPGGEPARWASLASGAALVLVSSQLIDPPPGVDGDTHQVGAWLALAATLAMAAGGALAAASISVTIDFGGRDRRQRVPAVDRREGPDQRESAGEPRAPRWSLPGGEREPEGSPTEPVGPAGEDEGERTEAFDTLADEGGSPGPDRRADPPGTG
ncbi:MAG TPA: hypothetical protein VGV40_06195 [Solirubrobacteraceae bacterium]|nr:hypothetical protein [Solirubrobacteraceae bacterium]